MNAPSRRGGTPAPQPRGIVWIGVSSWQDRAWVDRPAALENFEVKVIAGCASGGPLEADWPPDDHMRSVGRGESLEMAIEVCPAAGIEDAVPAETAGPPWRVPAGDGWSQSLMKDSIRDRDHHGCRRAHDVDTAMWVLPWRDPESLADVQLRTVHRGTDDKAARRRAGTHGLCPAGGATSDTNQRRRSGDKSAPDGQSDDTRDHRTCTATEAGHEAVPP